MRTFSRAERRSRRVFAESSIDGRIARVCAVCRIAVMKKDDDDDDDDACDVCLIEKYPAALPEDGNAPLANGWHTVIHPFPSMFPPEEHGASLCCPRCVGGVEEALGYFDDGGRTRIAPTMADREALNRELATLRAFDREKLQELSTRLTMMAASIAPLDRATGQTYGQVVHTLARLLYVLSCEGERG